MTLPIVIATIDRLARTAGQSNTAAVEWAVDRLLGEQAADDADQRMGSLLVQLDRVPDPNTATGLPDRDEHDLPR